MEKNYSCRLTLDSGKARRRLFASSVDLIGDDLVIHLSAERTFIPRPLATATALALSQCEGNFKFSSCVLMEYESHEYLPDIDSHRFRDAVSAYIDVYGVENFNNLINRYAFVEVTE